MGREARRRDRKKEDFSSLMNVLSRIKKNQELKKRQGEGQRRAEEWLDKNGKSERSKRKQGEAKKEETTKTREEKKREEEVKRRIEEWRKAGGVGREEKENGKRVVKEEEEIKEKPRQYGRRGERSRPRPTTKQIAIQTDGPIEEDAPNQEGVDNVENIEESNDEETNNRFAVDTRTRKQMVYVLRELRSSFRSKERPQILPKPPAVVLKGELSTQKSVPDIEEEESEKEVEEESEKEVKEESEKEVKEESEKEVKEESEKEEEEQPETVRETQRKKKVTKKVEPKRKESTDSEEEKKKIWDHVSYTSSEPEKKVEEVKKTKETFFQRLKRMLVPSKFRKKDKSIKKVHSEENLREKADKCVVKAKSEDDLRKREVEKRRDEAKNISRNRVFSRGTSTEDEWVKPIERKKKEKKKVVKRPALPSSDEEENTLRRTEDEEETYKLEDITEVIDHWTESSHSSGEEEVESSEGELEEEIARELAGRDNKDTRLGFYREGGKVYTLTKHSLQRSLPTGKTPTRDTVESH